MTKKKNIQLYKYMPKKNFKIKGKKNLKIKNTKGKKNSKMKPTTKRTRAKTKTGKINHILKDHDLVGLGLSTILSIQEANAIATGEINADTLKQYRQYFNKKGSFTTIYNSKKYKDKKIEPEYILRIFGKKDPNDQRLKQVFNKGKKNWETWKKEIMKQVEGNKQFQNKFNTNLITDNINYNELDVIEYLVNKEQYGGNINTQTITNATTEDEDFLDFDIVTTGQSYNDKYLKQLGLSKIGYATATIKMRSNSSGLRLFGLFSDEDDKWDKIEDLKQKLVADGQVLPNKTYTNRKGETVQEKGFSRENIEYALSKKYIDLDDLPSPPYIVDKIISKMLMEIERRTKIKADDKIFWEIDDTDNTVYVKADKLESYKTIRGNINLISDKIVKTLTSAEVIHITSQTLKLKYIKYERITGGTDGIVNNDKLCFIYAFYMGYKFYEDKKEYNRIKKSFGRYEGSKYYDDAKDFIGNNILQTIEQSEGLILTQHCDILDKIEKKFKVNLRIRKYIGIEIQEEKKKAMKEKLEGHQLYPLLYPKDIQKHLNFETTIDILIKDGHCEFIHNLKTLLSHNDTNITSKVVCLGCEKLISKKSNHNCEGNNKLSYCSRCEGHHKKEKTDEKIYCKDCHRYFYNKECFREHKKEKHLRTITTEVFDSEKYEEEGKMDYKKTTREKLKSICQLKRRCILCLEFKGGKHECGKTYCKLCGEHYEKYTQHCCSIKQIYPHQIKGKQEKFIFYDFETFSTKDDGKQIPFYCVAWKPSNKGEIIENNEIRKDRILEEDFFTFSSTFKKDGSIDTNCSVDFIKWLIQEEHNGYYVVAHNSGRFDTHLIVNELIKKENFDDFYLDREPLTKVNKYLQYKIRFKKGSEDKQKFHTITLVDSRNHIQTSVSEMPKMFGFFKKDASGNAIKDNDGNKIMEFKKGWCPYKWINAKRIYYKGALMTKEGFEYERLSKEDKDRWDNDFSIKKGSKVVLNEDLLRNGKLMKGKNFWYVKEIMENCCSAQNTPSRKQNQSQKNWYVLTNYDSEKVTHSTKSGHRKPIEVFQSEIRLYCDVWADFIDEYCKDDVKILGLSVLKHQQIFFDIGEQLLREQQVKRLNQPALKLEIDLEHKCAVNKKTKTIYPFNKDIEWCYNFKDIRKKKKIKFDLEEFNSIAYKENTEKYGNFDFEQPKKYEHYNPIYMKEFMECRVPDIWKAITSTQYTHELYRYLCYKDKTLITYQDIEDKLSSNGELEWLLYIEDELGYKLERQKFLPFENSVENGEDMVREISVDEIETLTHEEKVKAILSLKYIVADGYDEKTRTVYQYHGCYFHHHNCQEWKDNSRQKAYFRTKIQREYLENLAYNVKEKWECEWLKEKKEVEIKEFVAKNQQKLFQPYASVRSAYYGGRTEIFSPYCDCRDSKYKIGYLDYTSLYPTIMSNCLFPYGNHKRVRINEKLTFENIDKYFGIIYCRVIPPKEIGNHHIPLLPIRHNNKLVFPHCEMVGNWCSVELKEALKLGYEIVEVYEAIVWENKSKDLFMDFLKFGIMNKIYSSEFKTQKEMEEAIRENKNSELPFDEAGDDWNFPSDNTYHFKCELDKLKIKPNVSRRKMFKLIINAFYGRWGLSNQNKTQTKNFEKTLDGAKKFIECFQDARKEVKDFNVDISNCYSLSYLDLNDNKQGNNSCLPIAAFTTAYSRILLHRLLRKVGYENCLMCDTDSCIFKFETNDKYIGKEIIVQNGKIKIQSNLGALTDELEKCKGMITQFVGLAPKMYSYEITTEDNKNKYKTKAKGYQLDAVVKDVINFKTMKQMVQKGYDKGNMKAGFSDKTNEVDMKSLFKVKKNDGIYIIPNRKRFELHWKNDKRVIDYESDKKHIRTTPVNKL